MTKREEQKIEMQQTELVRTVNEIGKVTTPAKYEAAGHLVVMGRALAKEIKTYFAPLKGKAHESWKALVAREKEELAPIMASVAAMSKGMDAYDEQIRREAQEQEMAARMAAEDLALDRAARLEAAGMKEEAQRELERPVAVIAPVVEAPKVEGLSTRKDWDFEIVDTDQIAAEFLIPDSVKIRKAVRAHGENAPKVVGPGIRVFQKTVRAAR